MKRLYLLIVLMLALFHGSILSAQDNSGGSELTITGAVTVVDETTITVGGLTVDTGAITEIVFEDGMVITVTGNLQGAVVLAFSIEEVEDEDEEPEAEVTPEATPEMTPEPEATEEPDDDDDDDARITIVIEGPVEAVNVNVVTIYGFDIELDEADIRLTVIQVGDVLRIRGRHGAPRNGRIVIIAIFFDFVGVDVIVVDGQLWRDYGDCAITPPDWATDMAIYWTDRCTVIVTSGVPAGCRVTGMGGIKCSNRGSGMRGSGMN